MSIEHDPRLDPLAPIAGNGEHVAKAGAEDSADFRRLLESLERLAAEHRKAPPIDDADGVEDAIVRADEGYSLAMDLRRQLEDAFRQRLP